ncbi:MAG: NifB/NifX family molybdenum-iron cluster-binding protein [Elusimicrobiota bacterium]
MKICITSTGETLDSQIDNRFGRCGYYIFYHTEEKQKEVVNNSAAGAAHGAGIQAGQTIIEKNPDIVITGNIGPNAMRVLSAAGIKVAVFQSGTVQQAIDACIKGELKEVSQSTVGGHFGMQQRGKGQEKNF